MTETMKLVENNNPKGSFSSHQLQIAAENSVRNQRNFQEFITFRWFLIEKCYYQLWRDRPVFLDTFTRDFWPRNSKTPFLAILDLIINVMLV